MILFIGAFLAYLVAFALSALEATLIRRERASAVIEPITFLRISIIGLLAIFLAQAFLEVGLSNPWAILLAVVATGICLVSLQFLGRFLGVKDFGEKLAGRLDAPLAKLQLLFTPLSMPRPDEPEQFEQELIESVEEFGETIVREIMVPRIDVATVESEDSLGSALAVFLRHGYSRLPITGKSIDDIAGILYLKDVVKVLHESPDRMASLTTTQLARQAIFVPESKPVDDLLRDMQRGSTHIAIVIDEYGGVAGIATMEDVIEELVGDIVDEYDREVPDYEPLSDGSFRVSARFGLFDLGELLELELEDEDVDSVGGLLTKQLGRLPSKGDSVLISGLHLEAERVEGRRKRLITVLVKKATELSDAQVAFGEDNQRDD